MSEKNNIIVSCSFSIFSETHDLKFLTQEIGIKPDKEYTIGDVEKEENRFERIRFRNGWILESIYKDDIEVDVNNIIINIQNRLFNHLNTIRFLKKEFDLEIVLTLHIVTNDVGFGYDICYTEIFDLISLVDRFTCFVNFMK
ncbi:MAG: DUF4279 domain-containing protein [Saprospiraceae bacterium]